MKLDSPCCGIPVTVHTRADGFLGMKEGDIVCPNCKNKWNNERSK